MRQQHHLYLHGEPLEVSDEAGYRVEQGIIVDDNETPEARKGYRLLARYEFDRPRTAEEVRTEEARYAARNGPVTVRRIGENTNTQPDNGRNETGETA
jgi:hypothetical protein